MLNERETPIIYLNGSFQSRRIICKKDNASYIRNMYIIISHLYIYIKILLLNDETLKTICNFFYATIDTLLISYNYSSSWISRIQEFENIFVLIEFFKRNKIIIVKRNIFFFFRFTRNQKDILSE